MTKEEVLEYINHEIERSMEYDIEPTSTLREIKEMVESIEVEKEQIIEKLIDTYNEAYVKSRTFGTPKETLIRWDGCKEGISEAIEIVKGMEKNEIE